jgi:hypothetical protein
VVRIYPLLTNGYFSKGLPRDYISSPVVTQKSVVEHEREWSESSAVKDSGED